MKAGETTVRSLLQGERQYLAPLYQRRYSWQRKDLQQLWDDIVELVEDGSEATHFLGSVVLAPSPANTPASVQAWLVVDGQQRLTTLSVLLCAIRDHVAEANPQLAAKIDDLYLINRYADGDERYTMLPTKADRAAWIALVERAPDAGGDDRIGHAYRFFRKQLLGGDEPLDSHRLEQTIAARLSMVEIAAHREDNVHRIFESLNFKGQPLTQADLLRNYLFMRLPMRADFVYEQVWLPLQELLTDRELEVLTWLDLVLRGEDRATQEAVYQDQQKRLALLEGEREVEDWIKQLRDKARLFKRLLDPAAEPSPAIRRALDRLKRWGANVTQPIALCVLLAHASGQLDVTQTARALRMVESYLVRRMIAGISSSNSNRVLMSLVRELDGQAPTAEAIRDLLSAPRRRFPTDAHITEAVLANSFYWIGRGPQRSYVLRCLEEDYRHAEPVDFAGADLTIEHVLPQSPTREWLDALSQDLQEGETAEEVHASLVNTLGNLTLTAYNGKLSNDSFPTKRKILADSGLAMNHEIAAATTWGRAQIQQRGRDLAARINKIWPGPSASHAPPPNPRWTLMNEVLASIPAGRWTSYSDVAQVIGSHPVAVGTRLSNVATPNAHRVLCMDGAVSKDFRWPDPARADDPHDILRAEGIHFSRGGKAATEQRLTATDLAHSIDSDAEAEPTV